MHTVHIRIDNSDDGFVSKVVFLRLLVLLACWLAQVKCVTHSSWKTRKINSLASYIPYTIFSTSADSERDGFVLAFASPHSLRSQLSVVILLRWYSNWEDVLLTFSRASSSSHRRAVSLVYPRKFVKKILMLLLCCWLTSSNFIILFRSFSACFFVCYFCCCYWIDAKDKVTMTG